MSDYDSDLDDELLALAGDDRATKKKPSSSNKLSLLLRKNESDIDSDDGEIDEHDEEEEEEDEDNDPEWREIQSWGEDLMGDENDRRRLAQMTALDREKFLADRAERRQVIMDRIELKRKVRSAGLASGTGSGANRRISSRRDEKSKNSRSLNALKRQRIEKSTKKTSKPSDDRRKSDRYDSGSDTDRESGRDRNRGRPRSRDRSRSRSPQRDRYRGRNRSLSASASDDSDYDRRRRNDRDTKGKDEKLSHELACKITVKRDELEKWMYTRDFANLVTDCFVRIVFGFDHETKQQKYRLCKVVDVSEREKTYKMGNTVSRKYIHLKYGTFPVKAFAMDQCSNSPPTPEEYARYLAALDTERLTSVSTAENKVEDLERQRAHVFSNEEIEEMIKEKKRIQKVPTNIAAEKLNLQRLIDQARDEGDVEQVTKLEVKMRELDELAQEKMGNATSKLSSFAKLNEKNRVAQFEEARMAEIEFKNMKRGGGGGGSGDSPQKKQEKPKTPVKNKSMLDPNNLEVLVFSRDPFFENFD
ncbi:UNVERIFIED_CONTAM: RNA polymerase-associated protein rtf1, partial [Siphonaria sp. JEL0065]